MLPSNRGTVSVVAVTGALVLCLTALAAADLGAMLLARARAQAAADAAALAAIANQAPALQSEDPVDAARALAEANGATLERCECAVGSASAEVEVVVTPRVSFVKPWSGRRARAVARAELDPDVLSYRGSG